MQVNDVQLTQRFNLKEFAVSAEHPKIAEAMVFSKFETERIFYLCYYILQPIADHYHKAVIITSGKRTDELNILIGGSPTSQHLYCEAADFYVYTEHMEHVFRFCFATLQDRWQELILYKTKGKATHVHISLPSVRIKEAPHAYIKQDGILKPYNGE